MPQNAEQYTTHAAEQAKKNAEKAERRAAGRTLYEEILSAPARAFGTNESYSASYKNTDVHSPESRPYITNPSPHLYNYKRDLYDTVYGIKDSWEYDNNINNWIHPSSKEDGQWEIIVYTNNQCGNFWFGPKPNKNMKGVRVYPFPSNRVCVDNGSGGPTIVSINTLNRDTKIHGFFKYVPSGYFSRARWEKFTPTFKPRPTPAYSPPEPPRSTVNNATPSPVKPGVLVTGAPRREDPCVNASNAKLTAIRGITDTKMRELLNTIGDLKEDDIQKVNSIVALRHEELTKCTKLSSRGGRRSRKSRSKRRKSTRRR